MTQTLPRGGVAEIEIQPEQSLEPTPVEDTEEGKHYVPFDPEVETSMDGSWEPADELNNFVKKHFNSELSAEARESIINSLPRPNIDELFPPEMDSDVNHFLKTNLKERLKGSSLATLFHLHRLLLDVMGPLACLWGNMSSDEQFCRADGLRIIEAAMCLLGNASWCATLERRKAVLAKINPKLAPVAYETFENRGKLLFGPTIEANIGSFMTGSKALREAVKKPTSSYLQTPKSTKTNWQAPRQYFRAPSPAHRYSGRGKQFSKYQPAYKPQFNKPYYPQRPQTTKSPKRHT